jgi:lipid A 3-O-deacylase
MGRESKSRERGFESAEQKDRDAVTGNRKVGKDLKRVYGVAFLFLMMGTVVAAGQTVGGTGTSSSTDQSAGASGTVSQGAVDPVAEVRTNRSWEYGPFINWGTGVGNRSDFKFLWGGYELSKILSPVVHAGIFSGQFQYGGNIMPLWQAYTPPPHEEEYTCVTPTGQPVGCTLPTGGGTYYGVSITPVIFRWNFLTHSRRIQPWFQAAGGLIYTTHKFPPNILSDPALGIDGGTCVWNFSPQGGGGVHYFIHEKRSIDLGVNGVHISSASLGDRNPGVNASVQVQVGYTFWK